MRIACESVRIERILVLFIVRSCLGIQSLSFGEVKIRVYTKILLKENVSHPPSVVKHSTHPFTILPSKRPICTSFS